MLPKSTETERGRTSSAASNKSGPPIGRYPACRLLLCQFGHLTVSDSSRVESFSFRLPVKIVRGRSCGTPVISQIHAKPP
jgi:hypothetical protein